MGAQAREQVADERLQFGDAALQRRQAPVAFPTTRTGHRGHDDNIGVRQARSYTPQPSERLQIFK
jgi:hypothetical protein